MKKFIAGLLAGIIIASTVTTFAVTKIKEAYFNPIIKLQVDGKTINTEIVSVTPMGAVNGSNYVPVRALSEALGCTVLWANNTISITSKDAIPVPTSSYSYSNPAPVNTMQTIKKEDILQTHTIETKVLEIVRGDAAWAMIQEANMFNDLPAEGYEYILAKIYLKVLDITDGQQYNVNGSFSYELVSSIGKDYEYASGVCPAPQIDANLYKGASNEGWAMYKVKKDDLQPKLAFGRNYDGTGGIWFKAYNVN